MNVLNLKEAQIVWYDSKLIRITHIDYNQISVVLSYDILQYDLFLTKIGWDFSYFPNSELFLDLFVMF